MKRLGLEHLRQNGERNLWRTLMFLICTATLIVMVRFVADAVPASDPFDDQRVHMIQNLEDYGESQIAEMKVRHAVGRDQPYDIGLFGNSRILSVGRQQLDVDICTAFNFGLSGQSLRTSVTMLEHMAQKQALPRIAVISIDHFELQMYNNPLWMGWRERLSLLTDDMAVAFGNSDVSARNKIRILWRYIWTEKILFQRQFEFTFFRRALLQVLGLNDDPFPAVRSNGPGYRLDGSVNSASREAREVSAMPRSTPQINNVILRNDLERLFRVANKSNVKLLIYESPIHPTSAAIFKRAPSPFAEVNRQTFLKACSDFNVVCSTTAQEIFWGTDGWSDASHPPPDVLGGWISTFLRPNLGECAS